MKGVTDSQTSNLILVSKSFKYLKFPVIICRIVRACHVGLSHIDCSVKNLIEMELCL